MITAVLHLRNWLRQHHIDPSEVSLTIEFAGPDTAARAHRHACLEAGIEDYTSGALERIADIPVKIVGRA
jgi:hypothetical protein